MTSLLLSSDHTRPQPSVRQNAAFQPGTVLSYFLNHQFINVGYVEYI